MMSAVRPAMPKNKSGSGLVEPAVDASVCAFFRALAILNDCSNGFTSIGEWRLVNLVNLDRIRNPKPGILKSNPEAANLAC